MNVYALVKLVVVITLVSMGYGAKGALIGNLLAHRLLHNVFVAMGDTRTPLIATGALLTGSVAFNLALVPKMGMIGAALSALVVSSIGLVAMVLICDRKIGRRVVCRRSFARIATASALIYLVAHFAPSSQRPSIREGWRYWNQMPRRQEQSPQRGLTTSRSPDETTTRSGLRLICHRPVTWC